MLSITCTCYLLTRANLWFTESSGNKIGRITPTGTITEFPLPTASGGPVGIAAGPDSNLWFTETGGFFPLFDSGFPNRIGRITPSGTLAEFLIPPASSRPGGIAAGPDGNLWFTDGNRATIGRITPSGTLTEFLLAPGSFPGGIAAGPDGNLWFTESSGNKIGRITPSGTLTEFLLDPGSRPSGIAAGPDGKRASINNIYIFTLAGVG